MFHVLAIANFGSSFHRKNPAGAIEAFRLAFGSDPSARLTVKTSDGHRHPGDLACLRAAVAGASNIEIVDHVMSDAGMNDLYSSADVYLSLHRSEGYGLTLAEAMLRETPVVATAWSGNMDFCAADTTHLVGYDLVECRDPHPAYAQVEGAQWAAPRTDEAAWHLRHIRQFPAVAANKAAAARKRLVARSRCSSYPTALRELLAAVRARP